MGQDLGGGLIHLGDAVLDLGRGILARDGQIVPLRSKPFRLLCELARQPGRVVPKGELLDAVWPDVIVTEDSLSQAVRDVRKALNDRAGHILRTVARRGFMLCPTGPPADPVPSNTKTPDAPAARPRIALLPLTDRTGRPEQKPILDGLVEEMIAGLARFRNLTVVAHHSAFAAGSDTSLDLAAIGAKLRADYLVDGSARLVDGRLMLVLALNDVRAGEVLWGESFFCEGSVWLTLQDLVPRRIVQRLFTSVEEAGHQSSLRRGGGQLSAFEHMVRGRALFRGFGPGVNEQALAHFAAAIEADLSLGVAYSYHALAEVALHGYQLAPPDVRQRVRAQGLRGVQLSPEESRCHGILSYFHTWLGEFEQAEQAARRAVDLNPCDADALQYLAMVLLARGKPQACLEWLDRAMEINPLWPPHYDEDRAYALFDLERYADAAAAFQKLPMRRASHEMLLAACYARLGRPDLVRRHVAHAQDIEPGTDWVAKFRQSADSEDEILVTRLIQGVELALTMSKAPEANVG